MHPAIKILVGALMVVVGVFTTVTFWKPLVTLAKAGVGPLLVLIGAFIVWLETDEWKMRREEKSSGRDIQQQFQTETVEEEHETHEHEEEEQEEVEGHTCEHCGKSFDTERGLNIHKAQKHD